MTTAHPMYRAHHGLRGPAREILARGQHAIIGTTNPDGSVHLAPVLYLHDHQRIYIETSSATRKARNISTRPRATILVQDPEANGEAWVSGSGPAEILRDDEAQRLGRTIRARYLSDIGEQQLGPVMARYDDIVIAVRPERWMAWDMTAFNATLADHGVSFDDAETWFR